MDSVSRCGCPIRRSLSQAWNVASFEVGRFGRSALVAKLHQQNLRLWSCGDFICGDILCLADWDGWTCLLWAGRELLVSLRLLGVWHKRQLCWPSVQAWACLHHMRTARGAKGYHHWGRSSRSADPRRDEYGGHPGGVVASCLGALRGAPCFMAEC